MAVQQTSKSKVSLPKGLSELHVESMQWLSNIEFWKTEFNFFKTLINKNFLRVTLLDKMHGLEEFEKKLKQMSTHELAQLESEIQKHEHYLNKLESGDSDVDDVTYRNIHKDEAQKMLAFEGDFKKYKLELFNYIEDICN